MKKLNSKGFGILDVLLIIIVLAAAGGIGVYVYHKNHKAKTASSSSSSTGAKTGSAGGSTTSDPYAGWKTYTDATYHYSFRYPADWTTTSTTNLPGVRLLSPTQTVTVEYGIGQPESDTSTAFTPSAIVKLASPNDDLVLIAGYVSAAGQVSPEAQIVDSSLLSTYPLSVGKSGQLPNVPSFGVKGTKYLGALSAAPVNSVTTLGASQSWMTSADAKTSLLILESLTYQQ